MPRKWTREERKAHKRAKEYSWREKGFVVAVFLILLSIVLYLAMFGGIKSLTLQAISVILLIIIILISLMVVYGGGEFKLFIGILILVFIILLIAAAVAISDILNELGELIVTIILGLFFIVLLFIAGFFITTYTWEGS